MNGLGWKSNYVEVAGAKKQISRPKMAWAKTRKTDLVSKLFENLALNRTA